MAKTAICMPTCYVLPYRNTDHRAALYLRVLTFSTALYICSHHVPYIQLADHLTIAVPQLIPYSSVIWTRDDEGTEELITWMVEYRFFFLFQRANHFCCLTLWVGCMLTPEANSRSWDHLELDLFSRAAGKRIKTISLDPSKHLYFFFPRTKTIAHIGT
jgi:hypothetical protein